MPTPITTVTKQLTYTCPDELYSQSVASGDTATVTYTGPDRMWVMVDDDTAKISLPAYTSMDDGDSIPVPTGMTRVEITADTQTGLIILSLIDRTRISEPDGYTELEESLPNGSTWTIGTPLHLTSIHDIFEITYDFDNKSWIIPLRQSAITWDDILNSRNGKLTASDGRIAPDMPEELKQKWMDYRKTLRDLPSTFGKGTENETAPWKIIFPIEPTE